MVDMNNYDWLIGISNSEVDGVSLLRFRGTKKEIQQKLSDLVNEDKEKDVEHWDYGCETVLNIVDNSNGCGWLYQAYGCYSNYHIDYTAIDFSHIDEI